MELFSIWKRWSASHATSPVGLVQVCAASTVMWETWGKHMVYYYILEWFRFKAISSLSKSTMCSWYVRHPVLLLLRARCGGLYTVHWGLPAAGMEVCADLCTWILLWRGSRSPSQDVSQVNSIVFSKNVCVCVCDVICSTVLCCSVSPGVKKTV